MSYEVHLHPPAYPGKLFPRHCRHEPQFVMQANVEVTKDGRGRNQIEIDHSVCLACGLSRPCTVGGNILVDLQMLWEHLGWHASIGARIIHIRNKWARIATYLFDESGWNGRHEQIARLIDPLLTMKLRLETIESPDANATGHRMGHVSFDPSYMRGAE